MINKPFWKIIIPGLGIIAYVILAIMGVDSQYSIIDIDNINMPFYIGIIVGVLAGGTYFILCIRAYEPDVKTTGTVSLVTLVTYCLATYLFVIFVNGKFDVSQPSIRIVDVSNKRRGVQIRPTRILGSTSYTNNYYLDIFDPVNNKQETISINLPTYNQVRIGSNTLKLVTKQGYLGYEWVVSTEPQ